MSRHGGAVSALDALFGVLDWIIRAAALGLVAITGYYIYGILAHSGELFRGAGPTGVVTAAAFKQQLQNMALLTQILMICASVGMLATVGRYYSEAAAGAVLLVLGLILSMGMPFLIDLGGGAHGGLPQALARLGNPRAELRSEYFVAGAVLAGGGGLQLLVHGILSLIHAAGNRPQPNAEAAKQAAQVHRTEDVFLGPCWKLPFCRDTEKKLCPIRASKSPCWRTGRGCYCDQNVILQLSGGHTNQSGHVAPAALSRTANVVRIKTFQEKREACLSCPIYLHHQGQKYKTVGPLTVLALGGLGYLFWGKITTLYPQAVLALGRSLAGFSFGGGKGAVPAWANDLATQPALMWLAVAIAVIAILAYTFHTLEWLLYRLGI
ncbi:MAG: hypothetical protein FJX77_02330 [Armatimonadetes bacterium]|nr:hypothetical protein [Armatimonadota bacterium]